MHLPTTLFDWLSLIGLVTLGLFAIVGVVDRVRRERDSDANKTDDRLISLLKSSVEALERKVADLETLQQQNQVKLEELETRNKILEQVFQGKDAQTQEFYRRGFQEMDKTEQLIMITSKTNENVEKLYKAIEKHLATLERGQK